MKLSIKNFFHKCEQIHIFLRIWSHLLKKSLNFIFYAGDMISKWYLPVIYDKYINIDNIWRSNVYHLTTSLNPFVLNALFLYPWKHRKWKGCIGNKWVKRGVVKFKWKFIRQNDAINHDMRLRRLSFNVFLTTPLNGFNCIYQFVNFR